MKNSIMYLICTGICTATHSIEAASSPSSSNWTDTICEIVRAGYGWVEKRTGTKQVSYCIDKSARHVLKTAEQMLEIALADNRLASKTKTYHQLMNDQKFQTLMKQLNDRAYFDWVHIRDALAQDRYHDVAKFWKLNRINLSPCLRTAIRLYLEQNKEKRRAAPNPKENMLRFDLNRINDDSGYVEATFPTIPLEHVDLPDLIKTIRDHVSSLAIASPIQSAERRVRKTIDPSFSTSYLTSADEVEKAKRIYAVYFAFLFKTRKINDSIAGLFSNPEFLNVYNQVWERDYHLRYVLNDQLARGSLDACTMYTNHTLNISPLFAALICDMILSHEQQENAQYVSAAFKTMFFSNKKPYAKYIFMFLNSLTKEQKMRLYSIKSTLAEIPQVEQSAKIYAEVRADESQLELLAEIQRGNHITQLLDAIDRACIYGIADRFAQPATSSYRDFVLEIDLPYNSTLPSAGHSDDEEETGTNRS